MKKKINKLSLICLIICSVLCVALLVTQFIPWWSTEVSVENSDGEIVVEQKDFSVWGILSFPENPVQKQFIEYFEDSVGKENFNINNLAGTACIIIAFTAITFVLTVFKPKASWAFISPLVCGAGGIWGYLTQPALQMNSLWIVSLVLSALILAVSLVPAYFFFVGIKHWFTDED